jgi:pyrroline-5-carboxylate reductase
MTEVLLVGCGRIGRALLTGWLGGADIKRVVAVDPAGDTQGISDPRFSLLADIDAIDGDFSPHIVVLALKPQVMDAIAPAYRRFVERGATLLSVAAGKRLATLAAWYGGGASLVRAMPNTPAAIGRGITVCVAGDGISAERRELCGRLLAAVGTVEWVEEEALLDAVTAVSGSGPAYVFLVIETLAAAGAKAGLPADLAMRLARATVCGSGELALRSSASAETLRREVTSPKGTTEAALGVLMAEPGLQDLFDRAVAAATSRSRELAA